MRRVPRGWQRGHVARRLFLLFILSAFLPLALIAALSLGEVRNLLLKQGEQRLAATAKAYGMTLYERLLVASDVAISTAERTTRDAAHDELAHRTFLSIALLEGAGGVVPLIDRLAAPAIGDEARARLAVRKPVIFIRPGAGGARVFLAVARPGAARGDIVIGEVNPAYLWGSPDEMPAFTDFCVIEDRSQATLHCTQPLSAEAQRTMLRSRSHLGAARWERDGEAYRGVAWAQFMRAGFGTPDWVVIASQPESYQVERARKFGQLYVPVVMLALLLVAWLTMRQASHIVKPLDVLARRARGMAQNDFKSRVEMDPREDEFGELATAFDSMSQKLGRQFASLKALSESTG